MSRVGSAIYSILRLTGGGVIALWLHPRSALRSNGWFRSFRLGRSVDRCGEPIPWCTYAFTDFIAPRLDRSLRVFEYGAGYSTLFYASRVGQVVSVEHDGHWVEQLSPKLPANSTLVHKPLGDEYVDEVARHGKFDIVIIDGRLRTECAPAALKALTPQGLLVWDNSDRSDYLAATPLLEESGFRHIHFTGLSPMVHVRSRTTILYRDNNCLSI